MKALQPKLRNKMSAPGFGRRSLHRADQGAHQSASPESGVYSSCDIVVSIISSCLFPPRRIKQMESVLREAAISMKALWKDRGFSTTAILTLAVCLGANVAIFTIVNSVLLRPLPVPESERIVFISN